MAETATAILEHASAASDRFNKSLADIDALEELQDALALVTKAIGFDVFVLLQLPSRDASDDVLLLTSYPRDWILSAMADQNYVDDPVIAAARTAEVPFVWKEIADIIDVSEQQTRYMELARDFGIVNGFTMPFRLPGEPLGLVSFATAGEAPVNEVALPFAYQVASSAFSRARSIRKLKVVARRERHALTHDEIRSVRIAAQGKSDFLISRILDVTPGEVASILKSAQTKLGSTCRVSMVLMAIDRGYFTLDDALFG